jgi:hypothetical protein
MGVRMGAAVQQQQRAAPSSETRDPRHHPGTHGRPLMSDVSLISPLRLPAKTMAPHSVIVALVWLVNRYAQAPYARTSAPPGPRSKAIISKARRPVLALRGR